MTTQQIITFKIHYETNSLSEQLVWVGSEGRNVMRPIGDGWWEVNIGLDSRRPIISYNYIVERAGRIVRSEPTIQHKLQIEWVEISGPLSIIDRWLEPNVWHRLQSGGIADLLQLPQLEELQAPIIGGRAKYYLLVEYKEPYSMPLYLSGAHSILGAWDPSKALPMTLTSRGWIYETESLEALLAFKFILIDEKGEIIWEKGANRVLLPEAYAPNSLIIIEPPRFDKGAISLPKQLYGTAIPLFSLRTKDSYGVGDLSDAVSLLDWLQTTQQSLLQLLPFYDTTFKFTAEDSYPYNTITTFGLHPIYLDVRRLPDYANAPSRTIWEEEAKRLNELPVVAYNEVMALKSEVMDACFDSWYERGGYHSDPGIVSFIEEKGEPLLSYALFCTIRDRNKGLQVALFPAYRVVKEEWLATQSLEGLPAAREVWKHLYRQYHLYKQLAYLKREATRRGILLKGDLPIGIAKNSVDVWIAPHLFHLDKQAGSPPDAFAEEGQNWGFPTYHWEEMRRSNYNWWQARMSSMSQYIDAIRIDHILGFFRIWSIPSVSGRPIDGHYIPAKGYESEEVKGLENYFVPDDEGYWHPQLFPERTTSFSLLNEAERRQILALRDDYYYHHNEELWLSTAIERISHVMQASNMLICAEDLGVLPKSIQEVLTSMELLSLEVVRMPKQLGSPFLRPEQIPYLSVLTTGTHDMPSLRAWWTTMTNEEKQDLAELYHFYDDVSPKGLVKALVKMGNLLLILPLQDWFVLTGYADHIAPQEEQINHPENPKQIWQYRMPATIDQLPLLPLHRG